MRRTRKIVVLVIAVLCGLVFWPVAAQAALITIGIEAVVDEVYDPFGYLEGNITPGDIITGSYTYDLDMLDSVPEYPTVGRYEHHAPPFGISLTVGGFEFKTDPDSVDFLVGIANNVVSDGLHDSYWLNSYNNLPLSNDAPVGGISWTLRDSSATALSSINLLTNAPVLDDWGFNRLNIGGGTRARPFGIQGHVTSVVVIPEPATVLLFSFGGLIFVRRAKK
jgi:hypothetical protein